MMRKHVMMATFGLVLLLPAAAGAQNMTMPNTANTAYTNRDANMRAGPNREFPLVVWVPAGTQVYVNGCIEGYTWCDVQAGEDRGWIYADLLSYAYQNQPVTIISGGPLLGLPLLTFSVGPYWDNYYRYRPWYGNRYEWYNRPPTWWYRAPPQQYRPIVRPPLYYRPPGAYPPYGGGRPPPPRPYPPVVQPQPPRPYPPSSGRPPQVQPPRPVPPPTGGRPPPPSGGPGGGARPVPQPKPEVRPTTERSPELRQTSPSQRGYTQQ